MYGTRFWSFQIDFYLLASSGYNINIEYFVAFNYENKFLYLLSVLNTGQVYFKHSIFSDFTNLIITYMSLNWFINL